MAELVEKIPHEEVVLVVSDIPEAEEQAPKHESPSLLVPEPDDPMLPESPKELLNADDKRTLSSSPPGAEHGTTLSHLPENEKKALQELKKLLQHALNHHQLAIHKQQQKQKTTQEPHTSAAATGHQNPPSRQTIAKALLEDDGAKTLEAIEETIISCVHSNPSGECGKPPAQAFIWGVKLLEDERSDVILLKFLRARDLRVKDAFTMLDDTLKWRKEFGINELVDEEFDSELDRAVFMHGHSKQGHPVCYNVYGEFCNGELFPNIFSDEERRQRFLRWRVRFMEKSIRKLDFRPGGISTIVQVNDLKNSLGLNWWELRQATNQALQLFQDNYPEFVAKQIFINVPWWYWALHKMISPFLTQRTKNKFVVAGPYKSTETLFKYISAEQTPAQYGGLGKDGDFGVTDSVSEIIVRPTAKHIVEFPVNQGCVVSWEARVVGWDVSYGAEFVPGAEDGYTIIIQKTRKIASNEEQVVCSSYKVREKGKLLLTFDNPTSKKKILLYRFKTKLSD